MTIFQLLLRPLFTRLDSGLAAIFGTSWNPLHNLGALGFFFYWIVAATGIYIYIFFDTGITEAYESVAYMTDEQWYLAGVMRSLHRYASDALVAVMVIHVLREYAYDRYRASRWFTWVTGVPIIALVLASGITGYWLVWDQLAQYIATATTEWLDWLPIFGEPIARNFMTPDALDDRFFSLLVFLHIAIPLFLLLALWLHLQRVSRARYNPPRGLAVSAFVALLALSLILPATSHAPADLGVVPALLNLDWFYLGFYPLLDYWSHGLIWATVALLTLLVSAMPWLPPFKRPAAARVNLENCNGCARCADDCPHNAITMSVRSDGKPFEREAAVDASLCTSCGICAGSCPTSTPFRRASELAPGIDLPDSPLANLRDRIDAQRSAKIHVVTCGHSIRPEMLKTAGVSVESVPCIGALPPSFIDYLLSRTEADGVFLAACGGGGCQYRLGVQWTEERIAGNRDPALRRRVPRERIHLGHFSPHQSTLANRALEAFRQSLEALPQPAKPGLDDLAPRLHSRQRETNDA